MKRPHCLRGMDGVGIDYIDYTTLPRDGMSLNLRISERIQDYVRFLAGAGEKVDVMITPCGAS